MEVLHLFNFDLSLSILNGFFAMVGFLGFEGWQYKKDEAAYLKVNRKGDYLFGLFFIPFVVAFGVPYVWDYLDKNTWYNPATSITIGFLFDYIVLYGLKRAEKEVKNDD